MDRLIKEINRIIAIGMTKILIGHLRPTIKVCGLINGKLLGPYFYDSTLNGRRYHDFLINEHPNMLDDLPLDIRANLIFQQDGASAHNANIVRNHLNEYFPNRWIGSYGGVQ